MSLFLLSRKNFSILLAVTLLISMLLTSQITFAGGNSDILKRGMSGDKVLQLQKDLKTLGYFKVAPTGYFGDVTEQSVIAFQKNYKISTDGIVGANTYNQLDLALKKSGKSSSTANSSLRIVIDAGHGGIDPGTSKGDITEKEVTLDIAKQLKTYMNNNKCQVTMTRESDTLLHKLSSRGGTIERRDLDGRVSIINSSRAKLYVSIHVNSLPANPKANGSIVFYNSSIPESKKLAASIQKSLNAIETGDVKRNSNSIKTANFYILKNSNIPGVLIETAFVTNPGERKLLAQKEFRQKIARAIMNGIEASGIY